MVDKKRFKELLLELVDTIDEEPIIEEYDLEAESGYNYNRKDFIGYIMAYGKCMYHKDVEYKDPDDIFIAVSDLLVDKLNLDYVAVRQQDHCIALATPQYVVDAKNEFAKALRIIPEVFTEVSGPMSTVLIIDCEKQYLRKAYLGIGEDEWLL